MQKFEPLDISGDAGLRVFGRDLRDLFINAAAGMYSLITDPMMIRESRQIMVAVEAATLEGLFVSWLNELIFQFDTYGFLGQSIAISEFVPDGGSVRLCASLSGEDFEPARHEGKLLIKAATYHKLRIEKAGDFWEAEVIFDI